MPSQLARPWLPAEAKYATPRALTASIACETTPSWKNGSSMYAVSSAITVAPASAIAVIRCAFIAGPPFAVANTSLLIPGTRS